MEIGTKVTKIDQRGDARFQVDYNLIGEHRSLSEFPLHIVNISQNGFMSDIDIKIDRGERLVITLPIIGRIEAHVVWKHNGKIGFQFERIIRGDYFESLIHKIQ